MNLKFEYIKNRRRAPMPFGIGDITDRLHFYQMAMKPFNYYC